MPGALITKKALAQAMKELMEKQDFASISVGEICEACCMSRKGFYYHFRDKYDLVNWIYYTEFIDRISSKDYASPWDFWEDLCSYFYENRKFYLNAFAVEGQNSFSDFFAETFQPVAMAYIAEQIEGVPKEDIPFYCNFFTDAIRLAIVRWLKESPQIDAQEFVARLKRIFVGLVRLGERREAQERGMGPDETEKDPEESPAQTT